MARRLDGCEKAIMSDTGYRMSRGCAKIGRRHEAAIEF